MKKTTLFLTAFSFSLCASAQAPKKVIFEEYTFATCGGCPKGATEMENVLNTYPNVIGMANHEGNGPNADKMASPYTNAINNAFIIGYPSGTVDRYKFSSNGVALGTTQWKAKSAIRLAVSAPLSVDISSTYNSSTRVVNATVTANFVANTSGDMRISCILVEDSVIGYGSGYDQTNYMGQGCSSPDPTSPWYTSPCIISGFVHRHVARTNLSASASANQFAIEHWGTAGVIPASVTAGSTYSQTYSYTLPATWKTNRMSIVAFVSYYGTDRSILNANHVKLGSSTGTTTGIIDQDNITSIEVKQNVPNPFSDHTAIQFQLNTADNVTVKVYDIYGKVINTLIDTKLSPGEHTIYWFGDDKNGAVVSKGVFYYTISTSSQSETKPMVFIRE